MSTLSGPSLAPHAGADADSLVIFLHGYGADGNDLIDIGKAWAPHLPATAFISPHAPSPCGMAPFGREWFPLPRLSPDEYSKGVYMAADPLSQFITDQAALHQLPMQRIALVGFSQGTMMALHVGLRMPDALAGILGYSGALAAPEKLAGELKSRPPVSLIHGDADDVVPVQACHHASDALEKAGINVTSSIRPGLGHGIDQQGLIEGAHFLQQCFSVN